MKMMLTKKEMSFAKFCKELCLVSEYFKWDEPKTREFHVIRGYAQGRVFCPLAAVAYALHGVKLGCDEIAKACKVIGMPLEVGLVVAKAADGGAAFDTELDYLHEKLLDAVGL